MTLSAKRKAVLIFAAALVEDLERRKLQRKFRAFLEIPALDTTVTNESDIHIFATAPVSAAKSEALSRLTGDAPIFVHRQKGNCFAERLSNAIEELYLLGYRQVAIIGRDCPELKSADIRTAFDRLSRFRLVIGPDHRGGCYLIAFHLKDRNKLHEVQWQRNTDHAQLKRIFGDESTSLLLIKHDIDSIADVRLLAKLKCEAGIKAKTLLQGYRQHYHQEIELHTRIFLPTDLQRSYWQLPPPCSTDFISTC